MKPVACGNHVYSTGTLSSAATISAILFSNPSPFSLENGMLAGSAQTRRAVRSTRSTRWFSAAIPQVPDPAISKDSSKVARRSPPTKAGLFMTLRPLGFLCALGRASAREGPVSARLQVDVDVVDVAHHVGIIAERRHHTLFVGAHHHPTAGDDLQEVLICHGFIYASRARPYVGPSPSGPWQTWQSGWYLRQ